MTEKNSLNGWHTLIYLGVKNKNGRIYPTDLDISKLQERINKGMLFGEFGHPENSEISLSRVSHKIEELKVENNQLLGKINILETKNGNILNRIPKENIVFRPRSIGTVDDDGNVTIKEIISFDAIPESNDSFKDVEIDEML